MADQDIVQNLIDRLGQSQGERAASALATGFALVDERTPKDLLVFAKRLADRIRYYRDGTTADGTWVPFFSFAEAEVDLMLADGRGEMTPHLALLQAFLKLYEVPRGILNRITRLHLDFYYRDVLGFEKKPAVPDKAHVLIELRKNAPLTRMSTSDLFTAGKNAAGFELLYAPTRDVIVGPAKVDQLRSIFLDRPHNETIRIAPIANSADGLGGPFKGEEAKWPGFGSATLPEGQVGFAIASPVLRMKEGRRTIALTLTLDDLGSANLDAAALAGSLRVLVTGEKRWLGPYSPSAAIQGSTLMLRVEILESDEAVIDYDPAIHGAAFGATAPVAQVLLASGTGTVGYRHLKALEHRTAQVSVEVANVKSLTLENDDGTLNAQKAFQPFGAQPVARSRFLVGYSEALSKKLSELTLELTWKAAPADFFQHYANYGVTGINNNHFTASVSFLDAGGWNESGRVVGLFDAGDTSHARLSFTRASTTRQAVTSGMHIYALSNAGSSWAQMAAMRTLLISPTLKSYAAEPAEPRPGFITLSLDKEFLHSTYRLKFVQNAMTYSKDPNATLVLLNEPYTPTVQSIALSYKAASNLANIAANSLDEFADPDLQFFHVGPFGQMREHRYQREQFSFVPRKIPTLLPLYENAGELLIGLFGAQPGDGVQLLIQVAEGSADPDLPREEARWSVLCNDYWNPLDGDSMPFDSTGGLLRSGVVAISIPLDATTRNNILPGGRIWLKTAVARDVGSVCQLVEIAANAVELRFVGDVRQDHLSLPKGSIAKLKSGLADVKAVSHPYATFGGRSTETDEAFDTRVAERLRHRQRCITAWDYERVILERFPNVHTVKCIPHAKDGSWLAPGHVLVVVVPDLKTRNSVDPLQPKVDADTIDQITRCLRDRTGMQVQVNVKNPRYQKIRLDFKVRFRPGVSFNYHALALRQEIIQVLSPWAFDSGTRIAFGGEILKSVLLDFVEERDYVDFVTDFKMFSYAGEFVQYTDLGVVRPETPDTILVSDSEHTIAPVP
jgi:Baseplate J-like protein